jgi:hypothetical protein
LLTQAGELVLQDASGSELSTIEGHVAGQVKPLGDRGLGIGIYKEHTPEEAVLRGEGPR